jgi:hypothetical protein
MNDENLKYPENNPSLPAVVAANPILSIKTTNFSSIVVLNLIQITGLAKFLCHPGSKPSIVLK